MRWGGIFDLDGLRHTLDRLTNSTLAPGFWDDQKRAQKVMRERATVGGGTFTVQSVLGQGTTITTRFPTSWLQEEESQDQTEASPPPAVSQADASPGAVAASPTESIPA